MLRDEGGRVRGFVPYPAPTDAERKRWREKREAELPDVIATAIRARDNWYAGGFDLIVAEQRNHMGRWCWDEGVLALPDNEPTDLTTPKGDTDDVSIPRPRGGSDGRSLVDQRDRRAKRARHRAGAARRDRLAQAPRSTTRDLIGAMSKSKTTDRAKPDVLTTVISDLDREIARLTEARERLTTIEGTDPMTNDRR